MFCGCRSHVGVSRDKLRHSICQNIDINISVYINTDVSALYQSRSCLYFPAVGRRNRRSSGCTSLSSSSNTGYAIHMASMVGVVRQITYRSCSTCSQNGGGSLWPSQTADSSTARHVATKRTYQGARHPVFCTWRWSRLPASTLLRARMLI